MRNFRYELAYYCHIQQNPPRGIEHGLERRSSTGRRDLNLLLLLRKALLPSGTIIHHAQKPSLYRHNNSASSSRHSLIVISGFVFFSAILRTLYHEHINGYFPFDNDVYLRKISTLRLIISGALVGFGSQLALTGK